MKKDIKMVHIHLIFLFDVIFKLSYQSIIGYFILKREINKFNTMKDMFKKYGVIAIATSVTGYITYKIIKKNEIKAEAKIFSRRPLFQWKPNTRRELIESLKTKEFDVLIIGGGSAGAGCALDATTRGLSVALVDTGDFASQSSSKSTKLLHGGIRYLEKAVKNFDYKQLSLVREALDERKTVMNIAPYLTARMPFMLPVYNKILIPYFLFGMKVYDWISGTKSLGESHFINKAKTINKFPGIKKENLAGSIVYYDGQFNDSRLNVMLIMTAHYYGAVPVNYLRVEKLLKDNNIVKGAVCKDLKTNETFKIKAKGVINSTGPYIDNIRKEDNKNSKNLVAPSSGVHMILPPEFAPNDMALVLPGTTDGRVLFFIPWQGKALVGTTDNGCKVEKNPKPTKEEINFILDEMRENINYPEMLNVKSIFAAWSGIRPLVRNPHDDRTSSLVRNHLIDVSASKVITLSGGKWTTYRKMAEETIDKAIKEFKLNPKRNCVSKYVKLLGSHGYDQDLYLRIKRDMNLNIETAKHLAQTYGDRSYKFREYFTGQPTKLSEKYNYLEKEVDYCVDYEMAVSISDIITRRMRLGFIDLKEANNCIEKVGAMMKNKLNWSRKQLKNEKENAREYLKTLGLDFLTNNGN